MQVGADVACFKVGDIVYTGTFGTHAELHTATEQDLIVKLPKDADLQALAFLAVAAVSWNDVGLASVTAGDHVLVTGAGLIGQFAVQAARIMGARVTLASRGRSRLEAAQKGGDCGCRAGRRHRIGGIARCWAF